MMSSTLRLPDELWAQIASSEMLSRHDLGRMRLVCKLFAAPAASVMFRHVQMSRLKVDRDSFEHIAASEHLAQHVRGLVWHELDLEAWSAPGEEGQVTWDLDALPDDGFALIQELMASAAYDTSLFWFPRTSSGDYQNFTSSSRVWFFATLDKFPHLTTFISCPMPQDRVFTYRDYPMTPDLYRSTCLVDPQTNNSGFFSYMLEAMNRAQSNIRALSWQDENTHLIGHGNQLLPKHIPGFSLLTTIHLCPTSFSQKQCRLMVRCLKAATNLEHLSLCYERRTFIIYCPLVDGLINFCVWPNLTSMEVSDMIPSLYGLSTFLSTCTNLRHLVFRECRVVLADLEKLRQISPCQLTSIVITATTYRNLPESSLLDYVHRRSDVLLDADGNPVEYLYRKEKAGTLSADDPDDSDDSRFPYMYTDDDEVDEDGENGCTPTFTDEDADESVFQYPPYWSWGRFGEDGDLYYWQADDADEAQAETTTWRIKIRKGKRKYGDPLEYFSDWDSETDNHKAKPSPYGNAFDRERLHPSPTISGAEPPPGAKLVPRET